MRRRSNPESEANIRRIDTKARAKKQTHGFQVHFLRGTTAVTKMFSDSIYGGKEAARRAARRFKSSAMGKLLKGVVGRMKTKAKAKAKAKPRRRKATKRRR